MRPSAPRERRWPPRSTGSFPVSTGNWIWVGLTANRANLAYLAFDPSNQDRQFVLCLRGTMAGSPIDTSEDMQVGMLLPFAAGGKPPSGPLPNISQGAMEAFTDIIMGTKLSQMLASYQPSSLFVTGHSLGGAMATTISLWLATFLLAPANIAPFTFAAPTAGDANFAGWFNSRFPSARCVINHYDLVPNAWQTLASIPGNWKTDPFYPSVAPGPGPTAKDDNAIGAMIRAIADGTYGNSYVQPKQQPALNPWSKDALFLKPYPPGAKSDIQKFEVQVGFQHDNNTYLKLLGAPLVPPLAPVVASINPTSGPAVGGTQITITPPPGIVFSPDSVVDFGIVPALMQIVTPGGNITAVSPPGVGTVDVRVTNMFGTSPAVPTVPNLTFNNYSDQFTYNVP